MSLAAGTRLGGYAIVSLIGAGGMGEVYRARDTRLNRDVALKLLPARTAGDAMAYARFEREAQAVAALSHPNILAVHDFGREGDTAYVVMELLEGATLRDRLANGALPLRKAVDLARQVADGLAAAHARGIVHRDIKPDNLFVTDEGRAKILDFGLAHQGPAAGDGTEHTMTAAPLTGAGTILGTIGYMAPEQVRAQGVDARTDLFALGVVLYEMVAGQRAFKGETPADTMSRVLHADPPDLVAGGAPVPPALDRIVRRCLEKEPAQRFQTARDLAFALETLSSLSSSTFADVGAAPSPPRRRWLPLVATAALALAAGVGLGRALLVPQPAPAAPRVPLRAEFPSYAGSNTATVLALSADGRWLAFLSGETSPPGLVVRDLATGSEIQVPDSNGAVPGNWSPRGDAYLFAVGEQLRSFSPARNRTSVMATLPGDFRGAVWMPDDTVVFSSRPGGVRRISGPVGAPTPLHDEPDTVFGSLRPLNSTHLLAIRNRGGGAAGGRPAFTRHVVAIAAADGAVTEIVPSNMAASYAPEGYLLLPREDGLYAQRFDAATLSLGGQAVRIADPVVWDGSSGISALATSEAGTLAFRPAREPQLTFEWVDTSGRPLGTVAAPGLYGTFALSPDATRVVSRRRVSAADAFRMVIETIDLGRGVASVVPTPEGLISDPIWTADGEQIVYRHADGVYRQSPYASTRTLLTKAALYPDAVSRDGRWLLAGRPRDADRGFALVVVALADAAAAPLPVVDGPFQADEGSFSPDGRWISYQADETGRAEIYVTPWPITGERWQISPNGGVQARWSADGRRLFYLDPAGHLQRVAIPAAGPRHAERPEDLFDARVGPVSANLEQYAVAGPRLLVLRPGSGERMTIAAVANWTGLLPKSPPR